MYETHIQRPDVYSKRSVRDSDVDDEARRRGQRVGVEMEFEKPCNPGQRRDNDKTRRFAMQSMLGYAEAKRDVLSNLSPFRQPQTLGKAICEPCLD